MMALLQIYLLGQMRFFLGERPYPFKALPKAKPLLAYLLLNRDAPIRRESLAFKLWPDVTEKQAKARLRRHLYNLRQALPPTPDAEPWLLVTAQTVQWNPAAPYWLDVAAFAQLCQQANRRAEAITLYAGTLLTDMDEAWLSLYREQLQQQFLQTLGQLIQQSWQGQDYRQALIYCWLALAEDNLNEAILRQQLALHYALAERATAVANYQQFAEQLAAELDVTPLPETTAVYNAIQHNKPPDHIFALANLAPSPDPQAATSHPAIPQNIPAPLRPLIGRQAELSRIVQLLTNEPPTRLLTLTGTGGIGKTRLAIAVAQHLVKHRPHRFLDGIFFVSLAPLQRPEQILTAVAEAVQVRPQNQSSDLATIREHLRYKQCLIILDNFEHLLDGVASSVSLLQVAPELQILATSRTPLNIYGEQEYPIPMLALPMDSPVPNDTITQLEKIESVAFFTAVARTVQPHFVLNEENAAPVAQLCCQLDGLPLAIELAAARSKHFPPDVLLKQLTANLDLLTNQAQNVPDRHRSLEAALQWSYDLLSETEKKLLAGLSLFEDGFSVTAVAYTLLNKPFTHITDVDPETLNLLTSLADKNLIYPAQNRVEGELRFAMLTHIRAFARQKLPRQSVTQYKNNLLQYFGKWRLLHFEDEGTDSEAAWHKRFQLDYLNLSAVLNEVCQETSPLPETVTAVGEIITLATIWHTSGHDRTILLIVEWALLHADLIPADLLRRVHLSAGGYASTSGDYETAVRHFQTAHELAQKQIQEHPAGLVVTLQQLAILYSRQAKHEQSLELVNEAAAIIDDLSNKMIKRDYYRSLNLSLAGGENYYVGNYAEAERFMLHSLALHQKQGDLVSTGNAFNNLGTVAMSLEDYDKAERYYRQSLTTRKKANDLAGMMRSGIVFADLAFARHDYEKCVTLYSAVLAWYEERGMKFPPRDAQEQQRKLDSCRTELGEQVYQLAWRNGRNLTLDQLHALALEKDGN